MIADIDEKAIHPNECGGSTQATVRKMNVAPNIVHIGVRVQERIPARTRDKLTRLSFSVPVAWVFQQHTYTALNGNSRTNGCLVT